VGKKRSEDEVIQSDEDFKIIVDGTGMGLLIPRSDRARELVGNGAFGDVVSFGSGLAVDRRYVWDLVDNLTADGYVVVV
jgi:hypothetical protein